MTANQKMQESLVLIPGAHKGLKMKTPSHQIAWDDNGTPLSTVFNEPFYSIVDGLGESRHVFLQGNDLPDRFKDGFHIAELGFGTGLNLLATLDCWASHGQIGHLKYTAFESTCLSPDIHRRALEAFPELNSWQQLLLECISRGDTKFQIGLHQIEIISGDVRSTLPVWNGIVDAWYLDGFSPIRNPEMWEGTLLNQVATHTAEDGTFATYTAAGNVRRRLKSAGFEVFRIKGFARKLHMLHGRYGGV